MNGVMGMTDLLMRTDLTDRQRKFVSIAHNSADTLLSIINDILDFSKIEAGKLRLDDTDFDVFSTVADAIELLADAAQSKDLEIVYGFSPEVPQWVRGDPIRLRQILFNLVGNGIKFTERGEVVVRVSAEETTKDSTILSFEITDTGIGIAPEAQEQILQPFEQADAAITRKFGGTGLGLPIARQLIESMGGKLSIEGALRKGTTCHFTVKLKNTATACDQDYSRLCKMHTTSVLIADDNAVCREMLAQCLSNWGLVTEVAVDGQQALEMLRGAAKGSQPFQLALLDLKMPELSGIEVAEAINTDTTFAATSAVVMTTVGQHDGLEVKIASGNLAFLTKPVRQSEIYSLIKALLGTLQEDSSSMCQRFAAEESPSSDRESVTSAKILVAEDNPVNQEVTREYLKNLGCHVDVVETGLEALAALERTSYDLILMDCQMPEMDGFEATAMLRLKEQQQDQKQRTPIVAITANALEGERQRCLEAGMDDYISKPFGQDELRVTLQRWLGQQNTLDDASCETGVKRHSA
jgi:CheY-like chemotaxis protein